MPAVLNLGGAHFVVKTASVAAQVVKLLEHAVRVNPEYDSEEHMYFYKPCAENWERRIEMETIQGNQLRLPVEIVAPGHVHTGRPLKHRKRIGNRQLLLGNGGGE